jgi:hypothetical protein
VTIIGVLSCKKILSKPNHQDANLPAGRQGHQEFKKYFYPFLFVFVPLWQKRQRPCKAACPFCITIPFY